MPVILNFAQYSHLWIVTENPFSVFTHWTGSDKERDKIL
jgi:hypothetical protein